MNILEIKNNLIKLSYSTEENLVLGNFITIAGEKVSYVAQIVNLKSDIADNFAIAKLLFTYTLDGLVDNYDGSIPDISSQIQNLATEELLDLLPLENPIKLGNLPSQNKMLSIDASVFERNLTVFCDKMSDRKTFISNCIKQLFAMKEKTVIIDDCNMFEDYKKIKLCEDFKLPLNSSMIDYIFEYELKEVEASTKAVIQDIFLAIQQYLKTLEFEFIPIDKFIEVVTTQYKETQMPELALLKNKLIKYSDAGVFANTKEEILSLKQRIDARSCVIIDLSEIHEELEKEVLKYLHKTLDEIQKYIYLFVGLNDGNSNKDLLKQVINHNHVFTTIFVGSAYKYATELYQQAQNMLIYCPLNMRNDFAPYNTFLNKLNPQECIVYGKLTQGIPFITEISELDTGITIDDILGDKNQFIPINENSDFNQQETDLQNSFEDTQTPIQAEVLPQIPEIEQTSDTQNEIIEDIEISEQEEKTEDIKDEIEEEVFEKSDKIIEPINNILKEPQQALDMDDNLSEMEEILPATEELQEETYEEEDSTIDEENIDTEEDMIDLPPVVPVYPAQEENSQEPEEEIPFKQGDLVNHPRYGKGFVEKTIKYGNKSLCSISFENVGRRLLDPTISDLTKL